MVSELLNFNESCDAFKNKMQVSEAMTVMYVCIWTANSVRS